MNETKRQDGSSRRIAHGLDQPLRHDIERQFTIGDGRDGADRAREAAADNSRSSKGF